MNLISHIFFSISIKCTKLVHQDTHAVDSGGNSVDVILENLNITSRFKAHEEA